MNREFAKGLDKVKENDFSGAIEHFTNAISEDPTNVEYYAERAVAYLNTNQFELSMFDMNRCVEMEPGNSYRYSCRAFLKSRMGDSAGAVTDYEMAVKLDPEDAIAYNNLGLAQEQLGYKAKAQQSFERSNQLIGYNPKRFDEGSAMPVNNSETKSPKEPAKSHHEMNPLTRRQVVKSVFTKKAGFRDFLSFIRNGFKLKE